MADIPPPDVLDHRGRFNRFLIAVVVGALCAAAAYALTYAVAGKDYEHGERGAGRFIFYLTGLAFVGGYVATSAVLRWREKRAWKKDNFPSARVR